MLEKTFGVFFYGKITLDCNDPSRPPQSGEEWCIHNGNQVEILIKCANNLISNCVTAPILGVGGQKTRIFQTTSIRQTAIIDR